MGLKEAMTQIKQDTLFWTREVYESVARQKGNKGSAGPDSPAWTAFQPLVPISATMEQVEGTPEWSSNGAKVSPKGVQYCRVPRELWPISQLPSPQELVGSVMQPHQNTPLTNAHTVDSWRTR